MTTIPDYLILMAVGPTRTNDRAADLPAAEAQERLTPTLSMRARIGRRLTRWASADAPALATPETITPALRDYPYRATC